MKLLITQFVLASIFMTSQLLGAHQENLDGPDLKLYLTRLNLSEEELSGPNDLDLLNKLLKAHLVHIPFENLNMHTAPQRPILTDVEALSGKILQHQQGQNRGGYCYEVNELFFLFLKSIGFSITRHKASVWMGKDPDIIPWPSHQLSTVKIGDSSYLVDVGFGLFTIFQTVKLPSLVGESHRFVDSRGKTIEFEKVKFDHRFGTHQSGQEGYIYKRYSETTKNFERVSTFTLEAYQSKDFLDHNDYVQYKYDNFLNNIMYTRFSKDGQMIIRVKAKTAFNNVDEILRWINNDFEQYEKISLL